MDNDTFTKARRELAEELRSCPAQRIRRAGAGRKPLTQTDPSVKDDLQQLIQNDIAGESNNCRSRLFKHVIQAKLANAFGLSIHTETGLRRCSHRACISGQWTGINHGDQQDDTAET